MAGRHRLLPGVPRPLRPLRRGAGRPRLGDRRWRGTTRSSSTADGRCASSTAATWPASRPHLDHLAALGVGGLYLTPLFPAPSSHRYDADTFDHVDPLLGGDDALAASSRRATTGASGSIGDLTVNHAGSGHEWFRAAQADAGVAGGRVLLLPPASRRLRGVVRRADACPSSTCDPRSCAAGSSTGPDSVTGALAAPAVRPRRLARRRRQHGRPPRRHRRQPRRRRRHAGDDGRGQARRLPRRRALLRRQPRPRRRRLARGHELPRLHPPGVVLAARARTSTARSSATRCPSRGSAARPRPRRSPRCWPSQPWRSSVSGFNLLGSHDTTRFRTVCGTAGRQIAGAGLLFTLPGVPMVFAGDEVGLAGDDGDGARRPMPWDPERWDGERARRLPRARRAAPVVACAAPWRPALGARSTTTCSCSSARRATSACSSRWPGPRTPRWSSTRRHSTRRRGVPLRSDDDRRRDGALVLPAGGPSVHVWELDSDHTATIKGDHPMADVVLDSISKSTRTASRPCPI